MNNQDYSIITQIDICELGETLEVDALRLGHCILYLSVTAHYETEHHRQNKRNNYTLSVRP